MGSTEQQTNKQKKWEKKLAKNNYSLNLWQVNDSKRVNGNWKKEAWVKIMWIEANEREKIIRIRDKHTQTTKLHLELRNESLSKNYCCQIIHNWNWMSQIVKQKSKYIRNG